jgi:hypothetical protein
VLLVREVFVSSGLGGISAGLGGAMRAYRHLRAFGYVQEV